MEEFDLESIGVPKERIEQFQIEIEEKKNDPSFFMSLGDALRQKGKYPEAISCYRKALSIDPNISEAWNNLGVIFISQDSLVEAAKHFERAVRISPNDPSALFNLGLLYSKAGRLAEARKCHERVIEFQPKHFGAHLSLGSIYGRIQNPAKAVEHYEKATAIDPEHVGCQHMIRALRGEKTETAPTKYVEDLFDSYSKNFEEHLTTKLAYRVPTLLAEEIFTFVSPVHKFKNVLDLGCGTGLMAEAIFGRYEKIVGVDLSKKMLEQCEKKKSYTQLVHSDIVGYLEQTNERFDLILAADVFVYCGELNTLFSLAKEKLVKNGLFGFSVESCQGEDFVLRDSGRFAHSNNYIKEVAEGLILKRQMKNICIRIDVGEPLLGDGFIFQKL